MGLTFYTSFVGRRSLLAEIRARLAGARVVTLTGPGGVGKTRLALKLAEDAKRQFADGCWVVSLADLDDAELLAPAVAGQMGLSLSDRTGLLDRLADFVADRNAVMVLDNVERLLHEVGDMIELLRARCPNLRFLSTSRSPLRLSGEDVVIVPPMTLPDMSAPVSASPDALVHYEAVLLFVERARSADSGFDLTEHNASDVVALCRELDGLPLAVELAAARVRMLTPGEILENITERFSILNLGFRDSSDRHQSLRACVEWSFDLCTESERKLWERLSVFSGGCDLSAVAAVCGGGDLPAAAVLELMGSLVDKSVVLADEAEPGHTRFRQLPEIREFGRERAEQADLLDGLRQRHTDWYAHVARSFRTNGSGPDQPHWFRRLGFEHANLHAAISRCLKPGGNADTGLRLISDLEIYWAASGALDEARHWFDVALATDAGTAEQRAEAMAAAARLAVLQNDRARATELVDRGSALAVDLADTRARGLLLVPSAMLTLWAGDVVGAVERADRATDILRRNGHLSGELQALFVAGVCYGFAGDSTAAVRRHELCVAKADGVGEKYMKGLALAGLGEVALVTGDLTAADRYFKQSVIVKHELADRMGVAVGLDSLGRVATRQGNGERAALLLGAAEAIWDVVGMSQSGNLFAYAPSRTDGIAEARRLLGKPDFRARFHRGSQLSLDEAVRFALETTGEPETAELTGPQPSPLTKRELEVAELVADGLSNPEIAARLVISVRTAQTHVENILRKLGFHRRQLVAAWVAERRLAEQAQEPPAASVPAQRRGARIGGLATTWSREQHGGSGRRP